MGFKMHRSTRFVSMVALCAVPAYADLGDQLAKLIPSDGGASAYAGFSVALDDQTIVVGASGGNGIVASSGAVYLYDVATGQELSKLFASDGGLGDNFGHAVAFNGTTVLVGAFKDDDRGPDAGAAYLFDAATGQQYAKLKASDGQAQEYFGYSVALYGTTAVIGAYSDSDNGTWSGSAYLFDIVSGQELMKLLPSDGASFDQFGVSVAIHGTTVAVGAFKDDDNGSQSGSLYLFDAVTGQELNKLYPSDARAGQGFGWSLALQGSTAIVGAPWDDQIGNASGAAYLFDVARGRQLAKLVPTDSAAGDRFGWGVGIDAQLAIAGSPLDDDNGQNSGSAYLFALSTAAQVAKLVPEDGELNEMAAMAVAVHGSNALVGTPEDNPNGPSSGSVYLFDADAALGTNTCGPANPNSSGQGATMSATGVRVAGTNDVTLAASGMPTSQFGYFLTSMTPGFIPFPGGSQGNLCLAGSIGRYVRPGEVKSTGAGGAFTLLLDLTNTPQPGGPVSVLAGQTWYFQAWFRDKNPGGTSNFTDALGIAFL